MGHESRPYLLSFAIQLAYERQEVTSESTVAEACFSVHSQNDKVNFSHKYKASKRPIKRFSFLRHVSLPSTST